MIFPLFSLFFALFSSFCLLRDIFFLKKSTNGLKTAQPEFSRLSFVFEFGTIFLLRIAQKLGSLTWSRLEVSRDLERENKATNTGLGLGLVAEMNLVELGLVVVYGNGIGGLRLVIVYGDGICGLGLVVVYGSGDVYGGVVVYCSDEDGAAAT